MLLTKECDYGIRIIRTLADGEKKTVETICDIEYIPDQYAYKILKKLERAGFVKSFRGRDGGYQLAMPLDTFTVCDVVSSIDKNLYLNECLREDKECPFKKEDQLCVVHQELGRIQEVLIGELSSKTIKEVLGLDDQPL